MGRRLVAAVAGKIGPAQLDRSSRRPSSASTSPRRTGRRSGGRRLRVDPRHATVDKDDVHFAGTLRVEAESTSPTASTSTAPSPTALRSRRRWGRTVPQRTTARPSATSPAPRPPSTSCAGDSRRRGRRSTGLPAAREVVLHAHFAASDRRPATTVFGPTGRLEEGQRLILLDQVQGLVRRLRTKVTIKPVIDLNARLSAPGYAIPTGSATRHPSRPHLRLPVCTRPARGCDVDHVIAYDHDAEAEGRPQPGPTDDRQPRRAVPVPPPPQDPRRLALRDDRARGLRVDQPPRPPLPTRPHRHHASTHPDPPDPRPHDPAPHPARCDSGATGMPLRAYTTQSTRRIRMFVDVRGVASRRR